MGGAGGRRLTGRHLLDPFVQSRGILTVSRVVREHVSDASDEGDGDAIATGMGIGIAFGVALGVAMDNLAIGIPIGLAMGAAFGAAMSGR